MAAKKIPPKQAKPPLRLKVFATQIGFHDVIVAASSQKAALAAWGVRQNLFAQGRAYDTNDKDKALAKEAPGEPMARPVGSKKPFRFVKQRAAASGRRV
jgi:hypothetical protein